MFQKRQTPKDLYFLVLAGEFWAFTLEFAWTECQELHKGARGWFNFNIASLWIWKTNSAAYYKQTEKRKKTLCERNAVIKRSGEWAEREDEAGLNSAAEEK